MNQVNCPVCGKKCVKSGKTKAGSQRWLCKECKTSLAHKIDNDSKELQLLYFEDMVGSESASAARVRNHRATQGQMKNLLLVDPVKMVSMTILRNENLKKYLGET